MFLLRSCAVCLDSLCSQPPRHEDGVPVGSGMPRVGPPDRSEGARRERLKKGKRGTGAGRD